MDQLMALHHRIWSFIVPYIITAASRELEDPEISPNVSITEARVHMICQHHLVYTIVGLNGSDSG